MGVVDLGCTVGHDRRGGRDWRLVVRVGEDTLYDGIVSPETTVGGWTDLTVDLTRYAGRKITLAVHNAAQGSDFEHGYWKRVALVSRAVKREEPPPRDDGSSEKKDE